MVKLVGKSLVVWSLAFKMCWAGPEQSLGLYSPLLRHGPSLYLVQCPLSQASFEAGWWETSSVPGHAARQGLGAWGPPLAGSGDALCAALSFGTFPVNSAALGPSLSSFRRGFKSTCRLVAPH